MRKKLNLILLFLCSAIAMNSYAQSQTSLSIDPISIKAGGDIKVGVKLSNPGITVASAIFALQLPDGFTFVPNAGGASYATLTDRKKASFSLLDNYKEDENALYVTINGNGQVFDMGEGAIATFTIHADDEAENAVAKAFNLSWSNEDGTIGGNLPDFNVSITITDEDQYNHNYALTIAPFIITNEEDDVKSIKLKYFGEVDKVKKVSFDIVFPDVFIEKGLVCKNDADLTACTANDLRISKSLRNAYADNATVFDFILFTSDADGVFELPEGIYNVQLKNIVFGDDIQVAPYTANIYVGSPKATVKDGKVEFAGDYSANAQLMMNAMPTTDETIKVVDLSNVTGLPANTTITTANPNALIFTSTDLNLANDHNVVIGRTCNNLVLTDGHDFNSPKSFTATTASYTRNMNTNWGTIVLPYDVSSNNDVAYYIPSVLEEDVLKLTKQDVLPANTPALVAKLKGTGIVSASNNVKVKTENTPAVYGDITMYGSYIVNTKVENPNTYYINEDKFWQCNNNFFIDSFRSYLQISTGGAAKKLSLSADGIATSLSGLTFKEDSRIEGCYDINGAKLSGMHKGLNILRQSNGKAHKVLIK